MNMISAEDTQALNRKPEDNLSLSFKHRCLTKYKKQGEDEGKKEAVRRERKNKCEIIYRKEQGKKEI
jgi:hypothetical protein